MVFLFFKAFLIFLFFYRFEILPKSFWQNTVGLLKPIMNFSGGGRVARMDRVEIRFLLDRHLVGGCTC